MNMNNIGKLIKDIYEPHIKAEQEYFKNSVVGRWMKEQHNKTVEEENTLIQRTRLAGDLTICIPCSSVVNENFIWGKKVNHPVGRECICKKRVKI